MRGGDDDVRPTIGFSPNGMGGRTGNIGNSSSELESGMVGKSPASSIISGVVSPEVFETGEGNEIELPCFVMAWWMLSEVKRERLSTVKTASCFYATTMGQDENNEPRTMSDLTNLEDGSYAS